MNWTCSHSRSLPTGTLVCVGNGPNSNDTLADGWPQARVLMTVSNVSAEDQSVTLVQEAPQCQTDEAGKESCVIRGSSPCTKNDERSPCGVMIEDGSGTKRKVYPSERGGEYVCQAGTCTMAMPDRVPEDCTGRFGGTWRDGICTATCLPDETTKQCRPIEVDVTENSGSTNVRLTVPTRDGNAFEQTFLLPVDL